MILAVLGALVSGLVPVVGPILGGVLTLLSALL